MVAPRAQSIFTNAHNVVGIRLFCPDCSNAMRCEDDTDFDGVFPLPDYVGKAGPLGFVIRCDHCGCRIEIKGNRVARTEMLNG